jgi:hypothetical protein
MSKILLFLSIILFNFSFSQKTEKIKSEVKYSCSQKYGLTETITNYTLTVVYDSENISFNTVENQSMNSFSISKKTEKFIIGSNKEGNYSFFNITSKQFYYIDYYMNRYMTAGYGANNNELKQTVSKMMAMLKDGKSQKDVIQYLVDQTNYDF